MTIMRKQLLALAFILIGAASASGQSFKAFMEAAADAASTNNHHAAMTYYGYALQFDEDDLDVRYKLAESARNFDSYTEAEEQYAYIVENDEDMAYPLSTFHLGQVHQRQGDYMKAKEYYQQYISQNGGDDPYYTAKAQKEIQSCEWAMEYNQDRSDEFEVNRLGDNVNTPYSEFGAIQKGDDLFFSSLRFAREREGIRRKNLQPEKNISKVLTSNDGGKGKEIEGDFNSDELLTAHSAFNFNKSRVYYTICEYLNAEDIRCDLYTRTVSEDGTFGSAEKLPDYINVSGSTSTQPSVGVMDGNEILYFASNREGGEGMMDIWYSSIDGGQYSQPQNLSAVNTSEDDMTPFYSSVDNVLYFSSAGYIGLGGLDIYSSEVTGGSYGEPQNIGKPVNSSYNDVYYTIDPETNKGHFSSNRVESNYIDDVQEACCFDIYEFDYTPLTARLIVHTLDKASFDSLPGVNVTLIDVNRGETSEVLQYDPATSTYFFEVERGREYELLAEKPGYTPDQVAFNTNDLAPGEDIMKKLYLQSDEIDLTVLTFNEETKAALNKVEVDLIRTMNGKTDTIRRVNLFGNKNTYKVNRNAEYVIIGNRSGFRTAIGTITREELAAADKSITKELYLPLDNLNGLLPIVVYFDNDYPDPDVWSYTTNKRYSETYPPYYAKKQEFMREYSAPLSGASKSDASQKVENFFEQEVRVGNDDLELFLKLLKVELDRGKNVEVFLSGFTSPRYTSAYNYRLGTRRIRSVRNELRRYNNGIYESFITSKALAVKLKSFGESESPEGIISELSDERNSIYSVEASRERRTEISEANITGGSN